MKTTSCYIKGECYPNQAILRHPRLVFMVDITYLNHRKELNNNNERDNRRDKRNSIATVSPKRVKKKKKLMSYTTNGGQIY